MLSNFGLQGLVVRDIVNNESLSSETLGSATLIIFITSLLSYSILIITVLILNENRLIVKITSLIGLLIFFKFTDVVSYWFEAKVANKYTVIINSLCYMVFASMKILIVINNYGIFILGLVFVLEGMLISILLIIIMNKYGFPFRFFKITSKRIQTLLKESWPLAISALSIAVYVKIDQIMLGHLTNDFSVGVYSTAARITEFTFFIPMSIVMSFFPLIQKFKLYDQNLYLKKIQKLFNLSFYICFLFCAYISYFSDFIIHFIYGDNYIIASSILSLHIWSILFISFGVISGKWLLVENLQIIGLKRTLSGALINIIFNLLLIPKYSVMGATLATLLSHFYSSFVFDLFHNKTRIMFRMKLNSLFLLNYNK